MNLWCVRKSDSILIDFELISSFFLLFFFSVLSNYWKMEITSFNCREEFSHEISHWKRKKKRDLFGDWGEKVDRSVFRVLIHRSEAENRWATRLRVGNVVRRMHNFEIDIGCVGIRVHVCAVAQHHGQPRNSRGKGERGFASLDPNGHRSHIVTQYTRRATTFEWIHSHLLGDSSIVDRVVRVWRSIAHAHDTFSFLTMLY